MREDPGSEAARIAAQTEALVAGFTDIFHARIRDLPMLNQALHVQAAGFRRMRAVRVPLAPWVC